ncbi:putative toxin-antitoxin system toxin component, PIN family [Candidatus Woesearchaeota archaeon]|nr:putative toxin-antitoxin system toxin component, PIN family [Candidatus Woesearchaeota archaeon]
MRIVFDTNVLISATQWDGSVAQKLLFNLINADHNIFSSPDILAEYQKVLKRDLEYTEEDLFSIMEKVLSFLTKVEPTKKLNVIEEDPSDDRIIECALEAEAEFIISYDKHLLKLKEYKEIKIVTPEFMLRVI